MPTAAPSGPVENRAAGTLGATRQPAEAKSNGPVPARSGSGAGVDAGLDRCHLAVSTVLERMLALRGIVGPTPIVEPCSDLFGEAEPPRPKPSPPYSAEEAAKARDIVIEMRRELELLESASPETWAAFAAHKPPGMPVAAFGKTTGSWHRDVYLAAKALDGLSDEEEQDFLEKARGLLPSDERGAEYIRGYMDHEWGAARANAAGATATAAPTWQAAPEPKAAATPELAYDEPYLDGNGDLAFPHASPCDLGSRGGPLLKVLLENPGYVVTHADLGVAGWNDDATEPNTVTQEIGRLKRKLTDGGYAGMAERIVTGRDAQGCAGYVLKSATA